MSLWVVQWSKGSKLDQAIESKVPKAIWDKVTWCVTVPKVI